MHRPQLRRPELDRRRLPVPRALMARAAEEAQPPLQAILMDDGTAVGVITNRAILRAIQGRNEEVQKR